MQQYFINSILIKKLFAIENFDILLSKTSKKHLLITGKNGSGKTTLLKNINSVLNKLINNGYTQILKDKETIISFQNSIKNYESRLKNTKDEEKLKLQDKINSLNNNIVNYQKKIDDFYKDIEIKFNNNEVYEKIKNREFILAFFEAKRENSARISDSIKNIKISKNFTTDTKQLHKKFIEYMVKLRVDMLDAKELGEVEEVKKIELWFKRFEDALKTLYTQDDLKLVYDRKNLNFKIEFDSMSFTLDKLSDGYSSLIAIVSELMLRMEAFNVESYDMQGVVLIDEIETHLHVELQKKVLPFLTTFFPNIQFIVTTHSPFVLSSLSDTVILDLESKVLFQDLSSYSYDALIESYFNSDKYSEIIKNKILNIEKDISNPIVSKEKLILIKKELDSFPKFMAKELEVKINELKLKLLNKGI